MGLGTVQCGAQARGVASREPGEGPHERSEVGIDGELRVDAAADAQAEPY